jgi:hypothetical protein
MKNDPKCLPSRRDFMQLTAAGALTAFCPLRSDGRPADTDGSSRSDPTADFALTSGSQAIKEAHPTVNLNGTWPVTALPLDVEGEAGYRTFTHTNGERLAAQVPGEIHLDLMRAGRMEDPDISDNARTRCRWPEEHSWWYRTEFSLPSGFRQHLRQRLIFEGIDLYGQVFVNGKLAGATKDAFATVDLDVKHLLQEGANELVVRVTSGMELIPKPAQADDNIIRKRLKEMIKTDALHEERSFVFESHRFLRKAAYSTYGWDFCDALPNVGIWRGVRLEGRSQVVIHHLRLDTAIRGKEVSLEGEVTMENLQPWSEIPCVLELRVEPPQGKPIMQRLAINALSDRFTVPCAWSFLIRGFGGPTGWASSLSTSSPAVWCAAIKRPTGRCRPSVCVPSNWTARPCRMARASVSKSMARRCTAKAATGRRPI